jgi:hypothetical protein
MAMLGLCFVGAPLAAFAEGTTAPAEGAAPAPAAPATPAAAAAAPAAAAPAAPAAVSEPAAASTGNIVKLRDIERKVDELKEQVFRSKARLNLLKETVLHGVIAGSRAVITHRNEMSVIYRPIRYVYALDGAEIFSKSDESGKLGEQKELEIFSGQVTPGNHTLSVELVYQGNGALFTYMKGYKFTARSSHTFTATEGKQLMLKVVGFEKGNIITTDPKDRPAVDFRETFVSDKEVAQMQSKGPGAEPAPDAGKK